MNEFGSSFELFAGSNLTEGYLEFSALVELDEMVDGIVFSVEHSCEFENSGS